uniref:Terpene synthase 9 n=1 Tax=Leucophyllum frutescens TaxID=86643 RepID=A0A7G6J4M1_LEUFR|nr:terpene synthase 9 [Leucophyllum frutescens]
MPWSSLHLPLLPCSLNIRTELAKTPNITGRPYTVAFVCAAATPPYKWSIADQNMAPTYDLPSTIFQDESSMDYEGRIVDRIKQLLQMKREDEENPTERLILIDALQRLGVNSYFEDDIQTILHQLYVDAASHGGLVLNNSQSSNSSTLRDFSLFFRLMRQYGHYISADEFNKFKGKDGRFRTELSQDISGLMELYEAAQLSFEGENILDEAAKFSSELLVDCLANDLLGNLATTVTNKLKHPYHKTIARLTEKEFSFQGYGGTTSEWEITLRELAVMNLNKSQSVYRRELLQVFKHIYTCKFRWWDELGLANKLRLVRDQLVKWYTWSMVCLVDDLSLSEQRVDLTKSIALVYLIDDIFDLYGTLDELTIFTEAVQRWEYTAIDTLPDCMKMCYKALLDTTNQIGYKIYKKQGYKCNPIDSLKSMWASLCSAFLVEAKWLASGDLPTADVYLQNGKISSGAPLILVQLFFSLGVGGSNGSTIDLNDTSQLISSVATILRLWDDLGSAKDEQQDGRDGSYIECYRKDNPGISVSQAKKHVIDLVEKEWKILNRECFHRLNHSSASLFNRALLNAARLIPLMYSYNDNQQLSVLKEYVKFMLFNETT